MTMSILSGTDVCTIDWPMCGANTDVKYPDTQFIGNRHNVFVPSLEQRNMSGPIKPATIGIELLPRCDISKIL